MKTPTKQEFADLLAELPLGVIPNTPATTLVLVPLDESSLQSLWTTLRIMAARRHLKASKGALVWTVRGF